MSYQVHPLAFAFFAYLGPNQTPISLTLRVCSILFILRSTLHHLVNMSTTHAYYPSYPSASLPINMPQKSGYYPQYHTPSHHLYGRVSVSPPEAPESVTTSGVASYEPSATSSSYAGSASDYDSSASTTGVDLMEYMGDRLQGAFDQMPLDRSLAKQAQT